MKNLILAICMLLSMAAYSADSTIVLNAIPNGDSWPEMQAASDYQASHGGVKIKLGAGNFCIYQPWQLFQVNLNGKDFNQVTYNIEGSAYAMDAQPAYTSNIIPMFTNAPAVIMQLNKGTVFQNIAINGLYTFPRTLSQLQVDTMRFTDWNDHICSDSRTAAYVGIAIDPFCDSSNFPLATTSIYQTYSGLGKYYIRGMGRGGSTAIKIQGCAITQFVVGILITGGFQYNGELIKLEDNKVENCKVEIAWSQAQSKANQVNNTMVWGNTYTIFDGVNYGFMHNDASCAPFVTGVNIAGYCHQIFNIYTSTFPATFTNMFGEGIFKLGTANGRMGLHLTDLQIDFSNAGPGFPSPDFYIYAYNVTWTNCMLRQYNGLPTRMVLDLPNNIFNGGSLNAPPVCWNTQFASPYGLPTFNGVGLMYYRPSISQILNTNNYDTRAYVGGFVPGGIDTIHVNRNDFTGYFNTPNAQNLKVGEIILDNLKSYEDQLPTVKGSNYTIGYVSSVVGNTVNLYGIGWGYRDGDLITPVHYTIKALP